MMRPSQVLTVQVALVSLLRALRGFAVIDMRFRVAQLLELGFAQSLKWSKDGLSLDVLQLGDPFANVLAFLVAFLGLVDRIEDGVARFPAVRVVRKIPVDQICTRCIRSCRVG